MSKKATERLSKYLLRAFIDKTVKNTSAVPLGSKFLSHIELKHNLSSNLKKIILLRVYKGLPTNSFQISEQNLSA